MLIEFVALDNDIGDCVRKLSRIQREILHLGKIRKKNMSVNSIEHMKTNLKEIQDLIKEITNVG